MDKVTAVILTKNESLKIETCLKSLSWVDDILVIDDNSTDNTLEIVKKYTQKIIVRDANFNTNGLTKQRNFALSQVTSEWVFFIDADESTTPEFANEVREKIDTGEFDGFYLPRKNFFFGKWIEHSDWYPDYQLHLFRKDKGKYTRLIHEQVELDGKVGYLNTPYLHENYETIDSFLQKNLFNYAKLEAVILENEKYQFAWHDLLRKPTGEFLRRFFLKEGYKDGIHGLVACIIMAMHTFSVLVRVWESQGFKDNEKTGFQKEINAEIIKNGKEIAYWIQTSKISGEKNPILKGLYKVKRKLSQ